MDHVISEEPKPVCYNRLSILYYNTARFGCPSVLHARAIIIFCIYISPVGEVIRSCGLDHHQYADDTQLYYAASTRHSDVDIKVIETCRLAAHE